MMPTANPDEGESKATPVKSIQLTNASTRYLTAIIVLPIVIGVTSLGGIAWGISMGILALIGGAEFYNMAQGRESQGSTLLGISMIVLVIIGFYIESMSIVLMVLGIGIVLTFILEYIRHPDDPKRALIQTLTTLGGVVYVGLPLAFAIAIRNIEDDGFAWILVVFASTWGTDSFAYFGGRMFGKTPLAPKISPKKTREGAIIGIIGGFIPAFLIVALLLEVTTSVLVVLAIAPFIAIIGDLFESIIKRYFGVKDSHLEGLNLLPGHGGVLDRIDALLWVFVLYYIYLTVVNIL